MPEIQHYGCNFLALLRSREVLRGHVWTPMLVNDAWANCVKAGAISGDLNGDGDVDDQGEAEVISYPRLFDTLDLPLKEIPLDLMPVKWPVADFGGVKRLAPLAEPADSSKWWILERWVWRIGHFVQGDGTGKAWPLFDAVPGGSLTRRYGKIESIRAFAIKGD